VLARHPRLTASDVLAMIVHPVLSALGWDVRNSDQVRHFDNHSLRLTTRSQTSMLIALTPFGSEGAPFGHSDRPMTDPLLMESNGASWALYSIDDTQTPLRICDITRDEGLQFFQDLSPHRIEHLACPPTRPDDSLDDKVRRVIMGSSEQSRDILKAVRDGIGHHSAPVTDRDVLHALKRIVSQASDITSSTHPDHAQLTSEASEPKPSSWPKDATHILRRREALAYLRYRPRSGSSILLPGSVLTARTGRSLYRHQVEARQRAERDRQIGYVGDHLQVLVPIPFSDPRQAATFACGALIKESTVWKSRRDAELQVAGGSHP
jgi:hypothetical protein